MPGSVTDLLIEWRRGDERAFAALIEKVYPELRRLAAGLLRRDAAGRVMEPADLVHEAFFRLVAQDRVTLNDRRHFHAMAGLLMRRVLVDRARARRRRKRDGDRISLHEEDAVQEPVTVDVLDLDRALERLEAAGYATECRVVELRHFGGLTVEEVAEHLGVSGPTVARAWAFAKAWLHRELAGEEQAGAKKRTGSPSGRSGPSGA